MHPLVLLLALSASLQAGTVQGVILEHASGRPLIRTVVRLEPVPQTNGVRLQPLATRAGRSGQFTFSDVTPGIYFLVAARDGYFPSAYGQRLPAGRGTPIQVTTESKLFAELRLRHKGALTGRVFDENGVAAAGVPVVAYRARLPLQSAGSGTSDDRGIYRIHGLEPGKYWVRFGAHALDDRSGWLPTYGPQGRELRDARIHRVTVDADTPDADVSPDSGKLFRLSGLVVCDKGGPVTVTLSSETGRRRTQTVCKAEYRFEGLAPAGYEVFATLQDGSAAGFIELFLDRDHDAGTVQVFEVPKVEIEVRRADSNSVAGIPITLIGRRQNLAATESPREIATPHTTLAPGYWELRAHPPAGQYVESIISQRSTRRRPWNAERASNWYEVFVEARFPSRITVRVSDKAGQIAGRVTAEGKPVPGAPVFLWPVAESAHRSLGGPLQALSDTEGRFRFDSLPPGDYRALASFDVHEVYEEILDLSRAMVVHAATSQTTTIELPLWLAPW